MLNSISALLHLVVIPSLLSCGVGSGVGGGKGGSGYILLLGRETETADSGSRAMNLQM